MKEPMGVLRRTVLCGSVFLFGALFEFGIIARRAQVSGFNAMKGDASLTLESVLIFPLLISLCLLYWRVSCL